MHSASTALEVLKCDRTRSRYFQSSSCIAISFTSWWATAARFHGVGRRREKARLGLRKSTKFSLWPGSNSRPSPLLRRITVRSQARANRLHQPDSTYSNLKHMFHLKHIFHLKNESIFFGTYLWNELFWRVRCIWMNRMHSDWAQRFLRFLKQEIRTRHIMRAKYTPTPSLAVSLPTAYT